MSNEQKVRTAILYVLKNIDNAYDVAYTDEGDFLFPCPDPDAIKNVKEKLASVKTNVDALRRGDNLVQLLVDQYDDLIREVNEFDRELTGSYHAGNK